MPELWTEQEESGTSDLVGRTPAPTGPILSRALRQVRRLPIARSRVKVRVLRVAARTETDRIETDRDGELHYTRKNHDLKHQTYEAFGAARRLWGLRDEEILMEGPAGTGKTRALLEKLHFCAMKYPGFRGLIIRKTRESLTNSVLVTFEEKVIPPDSPVLAGPKRRLRATYYYPNGSQIDVGGMDKASKVMSTEYDMVVCFESTELTEEDFENLTTRIRNWRMPYQQIIADCNPGGPNHWLNKRPKAKGMTRLLSRHEDNPLLFDHKSGRWTEQGEKYIKKLDRLSGARRLRLRFGKWAAAEGMVYQGWEPAKHWKKKTAPPKSWRRIRVIDFGFTNPFVCQWWAIDNDGRMWLYREIYYSGRLVRDHAKQIIKLSQGENIEATICDWDAEGRATLEDAGISTIPAYKAIEEGLEAVKARLRDAGDGMARLFIMRDCLYEEDPTLKDAGLPTETVEEIDNYVYGPKKEDKSAKEEPVDKDNHGMDAMRYAVAYVDDLAAMTLQTSAEEALVVY
jgi:PBSX family phage terminase large subunit